MSIVPAGSLPNAASGGLYGGDEHLRVISWGITRSGVRRMHGRKNIRSFSAHPNCREERGKNPGIGCALTLRRVIKKPPAASATGGLVCGDANPDYGLTCPRISPPPLAAVWMFT